MVTWLGVGFEAHRRRHLEEAAQRRETDARGERRLEGQQAAATALRGVGNVREVEGHPSVGLSLTDEGAFRRFTLTLEWCMAKLAQGRKTGH